MTDLFWEKSGWEHEDRHLRQLALMPFERPVPFIPSKPGFYVVRGPRQVGKSCWLKQILRHYTGVDKRRCFYLSCEMLSDYRELLALLESVRNRDLILLDEVSFVPDWDRSVKHFIDSGFSSLLVVTGSHAYDLKRGADRMPGRFDGGGEFHLLPMEFEEFVTMRRKAGWELPSRLEELQAFFRVGGFPIAVAESGPNGKTPSRAKEMYWKWLAGDVVRLGKQESYMTEVLLQIALTMQTPVSYQTLAKRTSIGSHNTVQEYLSLLEACFAVRTLHAVDIDTGAYQFRKNKKFYFTDPLIYWLALEKGVVDSPVDWEARLAEMTAHEALARSHARFGFFNGPSGEIDFILAKRWALEVKWAPVATNLSKAYLSVPVPWKRVWTKENLLTETPSPEESQ